MSQAVPDMVFNVLALEFFTLIDDEFKTAMLEYDCTFLDSMLVEAAPLEVAGPQRAGEHVSNSSSWIPSNHTREPFTEAAFEPRDIEEAKDRSVSVGVGNFSKTCCGRGVEAAVKGVLLVVRAVCRIAGPWFACAAMFYGPYCLGTPGD